MATFNEALTGIKRTSQLQAQPVTRPGTIGVSGGGVATAAIDLPAGRQRIEARQRIEERQSIETDRLAEQKRQEKARIVSEQERARAVQRVAPVGPPRGGGK